jgi:hypothetical protein
MLSYNDVDILLGQDIMCVCTFVKTCCHVLGARVHELVVKTSCHEHNVESSSHV